jgi:hypothetical protein
VSMADVALYESETETSEEEAAFAAKVHASRNRTTLTLTGLLKRVDCLLAAAFEGRCLPKGAI